MEGNERVTRDNWDGGIQVESQSDTKGYTEQMKANEPFAMPYMQIMGAQKAYNFVLDNAGAMFPTRDIVDQRIIEEVRTGKVYYEKKLPKVNPYGDTSGLAQKSMAEDGSFKYRRLPKDSYKLGIITDPRQMGGYPEYNGTPRIDSDNDGMPDEWETRYGLNPNDPSDAQKDCNGDGYTNIEKYINGIDPRVKVDWRDLSNNYDTLAANGGVGK